MLGIKASADGAGGGGGGGFGGMASLFAAGQKGAYYDFVDGTQLAINSDGTGGSPAVAGACRWANDLSPNGNHLRNTVSSATRRANGVETGGVNYGLFNMAGFGGWPLVLSPFEIIVTLEQVAFVATDSRIIALSAVGSNPCFLQGSSAGKVRTFDGVYGTEINPGIATEVTLDMIFDGATSSIAINGGAPTAYAHGASSDASALLLGSDGGGNSPTVTRFKRFFIREGICNPTDAAGVVAWSSA